MFIAKRKKGSKFRKYRKSHLNNAQNTNHTKTSVSNGYQYSEMAFHIANLSMVPKSIESLNSKPTGCSNIPPYITTLISPLYCLFFFLLVRLGLFLQYDLKKKFMKRTNSERM